MVAASGDLFDKNAGGQNSPLEEAWELILAELVYNVNSYSKQPKKFKLL